MKLRISATFIACLIAGCLISSYASGSGTKAIGNILLKNGQQLDSITFEMPCVADTQVKIITDGQKHMLDTDSIDSIILWDKRYPDRKYMFKPFRSEIFEYKTEKITGISDSPVWLCCEQVEENASYWVEIGRPSFKKQKIQFNFSSRSYPSVLCTEERE